MRLLVYKTFFYFLLNEGSEIEFVAEEIESSTPKENAKKKRRKSKDNEDLIILDDNDHPPTPHTHTHTR